jgi:hypothetical protein
MSSLFAKIRKSAKEKNKRDVSEGMTANDSLVKREMKEMEPVTQEELANLLSSLNNNNEDSIKSDNIVEENVNSSKEPLKIFQAYGVYFNSKIKKFVKINIDYCVENNYTSIVSEEILGDSKAVAIFKMGNALNIKLAKNMEVL